MSKGQAPAGQDWKPQTFNFGPKNASGARPKNLSEAEASRAQQKGQDVEVVKKQHIQGNHHSSGLGQQAKKMDEDPDSVKVKTLDHGLALNIQRARQAKGWTQADLAKEISEKAGVITDYESGRAVPNEQILVRMEKAFGVHLRGAKAGQPRETKQPKQK